MSWTLQSSCPWTGQSWTSHPWILFRPITSTARRYIQVTDDLSDSEAEQYIESSFGEDEDSEHYKRQWIDHDNAAGSDSETNLLISETFEDYSPPNFEPSRNEKEPTIDGQFSWILLWIMNFQIRFNISETATESSKIYEIGSNWNQQ